MSDLLENKPMCAVLGAMALTLSATITVWGGNLLGWWSVREWMPFAWFLIIGGTAGGWYSFGLLLSGFWRPIPQSRKLAESLVNAIERLTPEDQNTLAAALAKRSETLPEDAAPDASTEEPK